MLRTGTALLALGFLVSGCAADPFKSVTPPLPAAVELVDTPFYPQREYQCGPAALATILADTGVSVHPDALVPKVYVPARRGSLQPEMLAASREFDRIPYVIPPTFSALLAEVSKGRPVLVLQNLGVRMIPMWHYAVVVGFSESRREVVLRSGTDERRVTAAGLFARTWQRSGNWGVVALRAGELPADDDAERYLKAVAAAESAGHTDLAAASYTAAAERWPRAAMAWFGLGNIAYARGDRDLAASMYRRSLDVDPDDAAALNNLAATVAAQGQCDEAMQLLHRALALRDLPPAMSEALASTRLVVDSCR